jgi:hypothetical protein
MAYSYFSKQLRSIEIVWGSHLEKVIFMEPPILEYFSKRAKQKLLAGIDYTADNKVPDFMKAAAEHYLEMLHQRWLMQWPVYSFFHRHESSLKAIGFTLGFLINAGMIFFLKRESAKILSSNTVLFSAGLAEDRLVFEVRPFNFNTVRPFFLLLTFYLAFSVQLVSRGSLVDHAYPLRAALAIHNDVSCIQVRHNCAQISA